jgi:hypothetical protein
VITRIVCAVALLGVGGCSDDAGSDAGPRVDWIDDALDAVTDATSDSTGAEAALTEVSATLAHVDVIVRTSTGTDAALYRYDGDGLDGPLEPRDDPRSTFTPSEVTLDPDRIFDGLRAELNDPAIIDVAIRKEGEALLIDATVAGEQGGVLLVLLGADGQVRGIQAA